MKVRIHESWLPVLEREFSDAYFASITDFVHAEYQAHTVYPHPKNIFRAFNETPFDTVSVVILGQDPYHGPNQADGRCFSVPPQTPIPPSLKNIRKEIMNDIGGTLPLTGDLSYLAKQGVLLLNATLTVRAGLPGSHQGKGWEQFTDAVIREISNQKNGVVFILWGSYAKSKISLIDKDKHHIIQSVHPSPLSAHRGFFGSKPFSKTNTYRARNNQTPIQWIPKE